MSNKNRNLVLVFVCFSTFTNICLSNKGSSISYQKGAAGYGYILLSTIEVFCQLKTNVDSSVCKCHCHISCIIAVITVLYTVDGFGCVSTLYKIVIYNVSLFVFIF